MIKVLCFSVHILIIKKKLQYSKWESEPFEKLFLNRERLKKIGSVYIAEGQALFSLVYGPMLFLIIESK